MLEFRIEGVSQTQEPTQASEGKTCQNPTRAERCMYMRLEHI